MENSIKDAQYRKKRVARLKKMIMLFVFIMILIPIILCIILFARISKLEDKLDSLISYSQSATVGEQKAGVSDIISNEQYDVADVYRSYNSNVLESADANRVFFGKKVYLTFDDGPSDNTDQILDILKRFNVKATFFVVQKTDDESIEKYRRIIREGHTLAMHSSSHVYAKIYNSIDDYIFDVADLQNYLLQVTGIKPTIYRFPGGSSNLVSKISMNDCVKYLNTAGITYFDWNVSSGDAASGQLSAEALVNNVIAGVSNEDESVVLMHDAKDKMSTVEALPTMIQNLIDMGASVLPITGDTVPVHHRISK